MKGNPESPGSSVGYAAMEEAQRANQKKRDAAEALRAQ
jgi:hypothetical protein